VRVSLVLLVRHRVACDPIRIQLHAPDRTLVVVPVIRAHPKGSTGDVHPGEALEVELEADARRGLPAHLRPRRRSKVYEQVALKGAESTQPIEVLQHAAVLEQRGLLFAHIGPLRLLRLVPPALPNCLVAVEEPFQSGESTSAVAP
jgi:hypothetical protein